jgi:phospholipid-binding lipoprotein MlaA
MLTKNFIALSLIFTLFTAGHAVSAIAETPIRAKESQKTDQALSQGGVLKLVEIDLKTDIASSADVPPSVPAETIAPEKGAATKDEIIPADTKNDDELEKKYEKEEAEIEKADRAATIADPIEPVNRAVFKFNDKFYFWVLKPTAKGYNFIVPEPVRISVNKFFKNVAMPVRFVNSLFQARFKGAGIELARFCINTTIGAAGFFDPAKSKFDLDPQERDFGQTLGKYGMGGWMYIVIPIFGPSDIRDAVGLAGDTFLNPVSYIEPFEAALGVSAYDKINRTSLTLGEYESIKDASVEPYTGIKDAYIQYRNKLLTK